MSAETEKILILGGTKEATAYAAALTAVGHDVTTSLAGRTREPRPVMGKLRVGGFGGAGGLADWMTNNGITMLLDATHPFAEQISRNAVQASEITGVPLEIRQREPWKKKAKDKWIATKSIDEAREKIPANAHVLLALGSQHIEPFSDRDDVHFIVRMIDEPDEKLPFKKHTLLLEKPNANWENEAALLKKHGVTHLVCRNSGGSGAYAKIEAARKLKLPVIMIARPN